MRAGIFLTLLVAMGRTVFGLKMVSEDYECGDQKFTCGIRQIDHPERYNDRYDGPVYPGQWPWYATVNVLTDEVFFEFKCGAVLISEKHVLTSRLCVTNETGSMIGSDQLLIRMGTHKQHVFNFGFARHRKVSKIHQPVDFDKNSENKVVILEMSAAVKFNKYVQPVCIAQDDDFFFYRNVIGWRVVDDNEHLGFIAFNKLDSAKKLCDRDKGSSIIVLDYFTSTWITVGIVDCESEDVIYVQNYLPFIINVTNLSYLQFIREGKPFDPSRKYPNLLPQRNCGLSLVKHSNLQSSDARVYEFPWIARVYTFVFDKWLHQCLGSLLNYRYVLIAYCLLLPSQKKIKVRLGEYDLTQDPDCSSGDETGYSLPFREYDVEYVTKYDTIIYLLRTTENIRFGDHIQPVCLPVSPELRRMTPSEYIAVSWVFESRYSILQKRSVTASYNVSECLQQTEDSIWSGANICISKSNALIFGNKGVPLGQYVSNVRFVQFGFVNSSKSVNILYYMDWIVANMEE